MSNLFALIERSKATDQELAELLPESMTYLLGKMTVLDIITIIDKIGGQNLTVPSKVSEDCFLARRIGFDLAKVFVEVYRNESISMPSASRLKSKLRARVIVEMRKSGIHPGNIALEFNITMRNVYSILSKNRGN